MSSLAFFREAYYSFYRAIVPIRCWADFGCGCGRTLPWIVEALPAAEVTGVDVDEDAIEWCRRNLRRVAFERTAFLPPLRFPPDSFDLIYCISVFTHLDSNAQHLWLAEFRRILRPGGALVLTVHGARAREGLNKANREELDRAGLLHLRSTKLEGLVPPGYHTTWHTMEHVTARFQELFEHVGYTEIPDGMQDVVTGIRSR